MSSLALQPISSLDQVEEAVLALGVAARTIPARDWPAGLSGLHEAGLYAWWTDRTGAEDLTRGLGCDVPPGRIYAGQTGATKWPSGKRGKATLGSRIGGNHLRGTVRGSTFRRTLAAALLETLGLSVVAPGRLDRFSEEALSAWMREHLEVAVYAVADRDVLADLERRVLAELDPPLNLEGRPSTATRTRLSECRLAVTAPRISQIETTAGARRDRPASIERAE